MKKTWYLLNRQRLKKVFFVMRLTFYLIFFCSLGVSANVLSQTTVSMNLKNATLHQVIWELEKQTDFDFVYSTSDVENVKIKNLEVKDQSVEVVLDKATADSGLTYTYREGVIVIKPEETKKAEQQQVPKVVAKGVVVDSEGEPLPGVSVLVVGNPSLGTATDMDGTFALEGVNTGETLQFRYVGMKTVDVVFNGEPLTIKLSEDAQLMDEVVVIAYGEQKRSQFTGSAAVINADAISKRPVTSVMNAIEGMAPGVQIQSTSGAPGETPSFRIRGATSINASMNPLIIVDGMPYDAGWNNINPNDVESVTILKDAASTAIYGARGGNGVVLVTTKKSGKQEKIAVSLDTKVAFSNIRTGDLYDVIDNPGEYYERFYDAMYNYYVGTGSSPYEANQTINSTWTKLADDGGIGYLMYTVPEGQQLVGYNGKLNPNATLGRIVTNADGSSYLLRPDDWVKETYKTGFYQDYNLNLKGGTDKMNMLASVGYSKDTGIADGSGYERFTGRLKGVFNARTWLRFSGNLDAAKSTSENAYDYSSNSNNIFSNANRMAPIYPIYIRDVNGNILYDSNGKVYDYGDGVYNNGDQRPVIPGSNRLQEALIQTDKTISTKLGAQGAVDFIILPELTATLNAAYNDRETRRISTGQPFYGTSNPGGRTSVTARKYESVNLQQLINYSKNFGQHNFKATVLHETYDYDTYYLYGNKSTMFSYYENQELDGAITMNSISSNTTSYATEGFGGRVLYDYKGIYNLDASYRRDASSRFDPDHRWGNFFSFGGAYVISREDFFRVPWIDQLKYKLSFGQNGNDQIGDYRYIDTYDITNLNGVIALTFLNKGNPRITWETHTAINTGLEFELFKGRLSGSLEYYYNKTTDMLASVSVPTSLGYSSYYDNVGNMRNSGIEFDLHGDIIRTKDFRFSMYVNGAINSSKVLELAEERTGQIIYDMNGKEVAKGYSSGNYFYGEGLEYRTWYMRKFAGIDDQGRPMWYVMDDNTKEISTTTTYSSGSYFDCGSSQPKLVGGFGGSFSWKSLDLSWAFSYRLGGYGYDSGYATLMTAPSASRTGYNFHKDTELSWTPENPSNEIPRWQYNDANNFNSASDRWLTKADYLNLQNVTLGYSFPKKLVNRIGIEGLVASVGMDNLFFLSHRKGFVPNHDFDGNVDFGYYPGQSRFLFNLKFDF